MFDFSSLASYTVALRRASYREASEDRAVAVTTSSESLVVAIASGPGAALAVETIELEAEKLGRRGTRLWQGFFRALDDALTAFPETGQTTLVALCLTPQKITGASVGSGEAWWITAEGHFDLTEAQKRKAYLGSGASQPVPFALRLTTPGTLLLASEGLFKYTDPRALTEAVRGAESVVAAAEALLTLASTPAGHFFGDTALIVAQVEPCGIQDTIAPWKRFLNRFKVG